MMNFITILESDGGLALGERGQLNCICLDDEQVFVLKMSEVAMRVLFML